MGDFSHIRPLSLAEILEQVELEGLTAVQAVRAIGKAEADDILVQFFAAIAEETTLNK